MDDPEPTLQLLNSWTGLILRPFEADWIPLFVTIAVLLICSALISGSEVAYFKIGPADREKLSKSKHAKQKLVLHLLDSPRKLLATILVANNFLNIGIVILSTFAVDKMIDFGSNDLIRFIFQVVVITFMLLLIGEVIPKVYATKKFLSLAGIMALPLMVLSKLFYPVIYVLINSTKFIENRIEWKEKNLSSDDLSKALELTSEKHMEESDQRILEGIVTFGQTDAKQIMISRVDVVALDEKDDFKQVLHVIQENKFSRIPVFKESFDTILGILYIKDVLPYLEEKKDFKWIELVRKPFFVPENKKIDDLLKEFQNKKIHLAVVVDEYGGSSGIVTLEDILEEIVGNISGEPEENIGYRKIDDKNFIFDGKTPLIDFYKIVDVNEEVFENAKGESDTIAGFVVEISGRIPRKMEKIRFEKIEFTIESANIKRVKEIHITLLDE